MRRRSAVHSPRGCTGTLGVSGVPHTLNLRFAPVCTDMCVASDDGRLKRLSHMGLVVCNFLWRFARGKRKRHTTTKHGASP
jgi:hypothetical protein